MTSIPLLTARARRLRIVLGAAVALVVGLLADDPATAAARADRPALQAQLTRSGEVQVIVGLDVPARAAPGLPPVVDSARRARIVEAQRRVSARLTAQRSREVRRFRSLPYLQMTVDAAALATLLADPEVATVEPVLRLPPLLGQTPAIVRADGAWAVGYRGAGHSIAVLDTGVDTAHPFFDGKVAAQACFSTPGDGYTTLCPAGTSPQIGGDSGRHCPDASLQCGHGTHVAGIAVGRQGALAGASGIAPDAQLVPVQVFSKKCDGSGCSIVASSADLVAAMEWVYEQRAMLKVAAVNMSLGSGTYAAQCDALSPSMRDAVALLRTVGIATVVSSGNDGASAALSFPACVSGTVSVGATTKQGAVASYSNAAAHLSVLAPGTSISSSYPGGSHVASSGTSMAAPHVAGAWAVMKSARPQASVADVLAALVGTGLPITDARQNLSKPLVQLGDRPGAQGAVNALIGNSSAVVNHASASRGGVASASSVHSAGYPAKAVNDGDRSGVGWGSGGGWQDGTPDSHPDWVQIDFPGLRTIGEIGVFSVQDGYLDPSTPTESTTFQHWGLTGFEVQAWVGGVWSTVGGGNVVGNDRVWRRIAFSPVSTSRIRVLVHGAKGGYSRMTEVEAWGPAGTANQPPSVSLTAPGAGATHAAPADVTLAADALDADGRVVRVDFYADSIKVGTASAAPYAAVWRSAPAGTYSLTAVAVDDVGASTASAPRTLFVDGAVVNHSALARGATITASSAYSGAYPVSSIGDGDRAGIRWGQGGGWNDASPDQFPDWVQIDLAGERSIGEVSVFSVQDDYLNPSTPTESMTFSLYGVTAFTIQSWNGSAWVDVPGGSVAGNDRVWRRVMFQPVVTSRLRIRIDAALGGYSRLVEVEAAGPPVGAPTLVNHALASRGGVATASSVHGAGHSIQAINDADRAGRHWGNGGGWNDATPNAYPDWAQVEFPASRSVSSIDVITVQDDYASPKSPTTTMTFGLWGVTDYEVQTWNGTAWVTVPGGRVAGNDRVWRRFSFDPIPTTKIRVLVLAALNGYSRLIEVEAWGTAAAAQSTVATTPQARRPAR